MTWISTSLNTYTCLYDFNTNFSEKEFHLCGCIIYDSRIKADVKCKNRHVQFLAHYFSMSKNAKEMIVTSNENILMYFGLRQKIFLICTHKAHFWKFQKNYRFRYKLSYFASQIEESQKLWVRTSGTKKIYENKLHTYI